MFSDVFSGEILMETLMTCRLHLGPLGINFGDISDTFSMFSRGAKKGTPGEMF